MSQSYAEIRLFLNERFPGFGDILPQDRPAHPTIRSISRSEIRRCLLLPANVHSDICLICGWGDGTIPRTAMSDPLLKTRKIIILLFQYEEISFAASLDSDILELWRNSCATLSLMRNKDDLRAFMETHFHDHPSVTRIAGLDIIQEHPLAPEAEECRNRLMPLIQQTLTDKPSMLGNDIGDTFTGLLHAAKNAPYLLAAPDMGDLDGFLGNTPVISIAAGPSLKDHIDTLRQLQDKCILIACDAVLAGLLDAGIRPHFVSALERLEKTATMVERAGECDAIYAGLPVVNPRGRSYFKDRLICVLAGDQVYHWLQPDRPQRIYCGCSSGVLSVALACHMTRGPVFLVGHDLSRKDENSHWSQAEFAGGQWKDSQKKISSDPTTRWLGGLEERWIEGNAGNLVQSTTWWFRFRNEISLLCAFAAQKTGTKVYNINAHHQIGAAIENTFAAPLPDPDSLPLVTLPRQILDARYPDRVERWKVRAKLLGDDTEKMNAAFTSLRDLIITKMKSPDESTWDLPNLAQQANLMDHVSPGNKSAFAYFLRSALTNLEVELQIRKRTPSRIRSRWAVMETIDSFAHAVQNALKTLGPDLQEIADLQEQEPVPDFTNMETQS